MCWCLQSWKPTLYHGSSKIFEILFCLEKSIKRQLLRWEWGSKCSYPKVNECSFTSQKCLFIFRITLLLSRSALSFLGIPFYFLEVPFHFSKMSNYCFVELPFSIPKLLVFLITLLKLLHGVCFLWILFKFQPPW